MIMKGCWIGMAVLLAGWASAGFAQQQGKAQLNEDYTYNEISFAPRPLHYTPDGEGVTTTNGKARFNRALYGAHTGFRVECSDRTEFGIYLPGMGGNLLLTLPEGACEARYLPGRMEYRQGGIEVEVQVVREGEDGAFWRLKNTTRKAQTIGVEFGGVSGKKFYRNGDLGVDDPEAFSRKPEYCQTNSYTFDNERVSVSYENKTKGEVTLILPLDDKRTSRLPHLVGQLSLQPKEEVILAYFPRAERNYTQSELRELMAQAETTRKELASTLKMQTPDPWLNPIAGALGIAADGIWSGRTWLHGSIGWRTEHLGWRGAYVGTSLGWHERAKTHFRTYAANMVRDVEPQFGHPRQDSTLNLARAEKRWGTPMYSNGYICRRPGKREMSHYDMNMVYIDALLRYIRATGDEDFMREMFPTLQLHLEWEKRNFDSDGDHLYDGYCCIWASDALYYNGGGATHSSAYNYFANREVARIAERIGEDPTPYRTEAKAIHRAMQEKLWDSEGNHWGEFRDRMGHQRLHTSAALWSIYHAIDSEVGTPLQMAASARYAQQQLPHLPVRSTDFKEEWYLPATSDWQPYIWSINNVAIAEVMHAALAYWQAGMNEEAFHLMKGVVMDNMYLGTSPLNFGQISYLDAARGECYRDFADPIGVWSRALVEGLYGIRPDLIAGEVTLQPGFPKAWNKADIHTSELDYRFERKGLKSTYTITHRHPAKTEIRLVVDGSTVEWVKVNGRRVAFEEVPYSYGKPRIAIRLTWDDRYKVVIKERREVEAAKMEVGPKGFIKGEKNNLTFYEGVQSGVEQLKPRLEYDAPKGYRTIRLTEAYNASVNDIYRNEYLSPRPDVTTLQIPKQGYGDWCHPQAEAEIDDSGLRALLRQNSVDERLGRIERNQIPMLLAHTGNNVVFTSLWDNYPTSVTLPLEGQGRRLLLIMAGSTNHMQSHLPNGRLTVRYTDGTTSELELINPDNWPSIEQAGVNDGYSYRAPQLWRLGLKNGLLSRTLAEEMGATSGANRMIQGGAATLVEMPINPTKELQSLHLESLSQDVVIGIMGITVEE